jgi:cyclic pyranopterin phosphate synthase
VTLAIVYVLHLTVKCDCADEADLVSLVRKGVSIKDLANHIERALQRKQERHDGIGMDQPERPMWRIGG